ncbi:hypothetical protein lerEdw1_017341, partial [Lerista edwardsae]
MDTYHSFRDPSQLDKGGAHEGLQHLGPYGNIPNIVAELTGDNIPKDFTDDQGYLDPPNPCPVGKTDSLIRILQAVQPLRFPKMSLQLMTDALKIPQIRHSSAKNTNFISIFSIQSMTFPAWANGFFHNKNLLFEKLKGGPKRKKR